MSTFEDHPPFTGTHSHAHGADGQPDEPFNRHQHAHSHADDSRHDHDHSAAPPTRPSQGTVAPDADGPYFAGDAHVNADGVLPVAQAQNVAPYVQRDRAVLDDVQQLVRRAPVRLEGWPVRRPPQPASSPPQQVERRAPPAKPPRQYRPDPSLEEIQRRFAEMRDEVQRLERWARGEPS